MTRRPRQRPWARVLLCLSVCVFAAALTPAMVRAVETSSRVVEVIDSDTLRIDPPLDGLAEVRLAGIQGAKPPLDRPADRPWPLALQANRTLTNLAQGEPVRLVPAERPVDRYGRLLAQVYLADGRWLQGELLRAGLARVATTLDSRSRVADMLAIGAHRPRRAARPVGLAGVRARLADDGARSHRQLCRG
jgi:micrococcal nuclease